MTLLPLPRKWRWQIGLPLAAVFWAAWLDAGAAPPKSETGESAQRRFITPNEFEGTDGGRINQAIKAATGADCRVVIPRVNLRDGQRHDVWLLDSAILLPSDTTLELDNCRIKLSDRCRDNFIRSANCGLGITEIESMRNVRGFFRLAQRGGHWWFITPTGKSFFSIALNHIDPTPLRYLANTDLWEQKYGNSMERWLKEAVATDLRAWGFNSVGWTQEVVTRGLTNHRHSRAFTFEEYQWLDMPYCHQLPFADFHQWDAEVRHPDFSSPEFAAWCDYVAREYCARMKDDPKLIGYFYVDCPTWIHTTQFTGWKGPLFDPLKLETEAGRKELYQLATTYYRITHDAIRRYDKNHLILGDRYEAGRPIAEEVIQAAKPYVDVLSFQHFSTPVKVAENLRLWHQKTGKPVLLADHAMSVKQPDGSLRHNGTGYAEMLGRLRDVPGCVGYHLCGAYLRNECRRRALRDAAEQPDEEAIQAITQANREAAQWMRGSQR